MSKVPEGWVLDPVINRETVESDSYEHWTVAGLKDMLEDFDDDARVWIIGYNPEYSEGKEGPEVEWQTVIRPCEIFQGQGPMEVFLG